MRDEVYLTFLNVPHAVFSQALRQFFKRLKINVLWQGRVGRNVRIRTPSFMFGRGKGPSVVRG